MKQWRSFSQKNLKRSEQEQSEKNSSWSRMCRRKGASKWRDTTEKDGEWNIFSTIIDDFLFDEFICLDALKARLLYERFKELTEDMDSLLTNNPRVNVMTYSEAIERKQADTPQNERSE